MINKCALFSSIMLCVAPLSPTSRLYAKDKITLSTGVDYSRGDYGARSDTEIWYMPFLIKLEKPDVVYKLTIPYIRITGPGNVIGVDAEPGGGGSSKTTTESGLGDVLAAVSYTLLPYQAKRPFVDITAKVKYATADENRGLGSGELDYYIQAGGFYSLVRASAFGTLGYKIYGEPPGVNYRNVFYYSLGGSYSISQKMSTGIVYDYRESAIKSGTGPVELTAYVNQKLNKQKKLLGYLVKGLSDGSPDWEIGINMSYTL